MVVLITFLIFITSLVGMLIGFGASTLLIPLLLLWLPVPSVLLLVGFLHLVNSLVKVFFFFKNIPWRLVGMFVIPVMGMSFFGARYSFMINRIFFLRLLGIFLCFYVFLEWFHKRLLFPRNKIVALGGGALYGFLQGLVGIGGSLRAAILYPYELSSAAFVAANGFIALLVDIARLTTYASHCNARIFTWWEYILFISAVLVSGFLGRYLVGKISVGMLRKLVLLAIFLIGLKFIIFAY